MFVEFCSEQISTSFYVFDFIITAIAMIQEGIFADLRIE